MGDIQPYVVQGNRGEGLDYLQAGMQMGSQIAQAANFLEQQRVADINAMKPVIEYMEKSGLLHRGLKENDDFAKLYISKMTRETRPEKIQEMYDNWSQGLRTFDEQIAEARAEGGERIVRGEQPPSPPAPTPTPESTPQPQQVSGQVKGAVPTQVGPLSMKQFYQMYSGKPLEGVSPDFDYGYGTNSTYARAKEEFKKNPSLEQQVDFYDAWRRSGLSVEEFKKQNPPATVNMGMVAQNEKNQKLKDTTNIVQQGKEVKSPYPEPKPQTVILPDQSLGAINNGVYTPNKYAASGNSNEILKQLATTSGYLKGGGDERSDRVAMLGYASNVLWGRNKKKYMERYPNLSEEDAKKQFMGLKGNKPAWKDEGFGLEIATPVDLTTAEVTGRKETEKLDKTATADSEILKKYPEDVINTTLKEQSEGKPWRLMTYPEAGQDIERLKRDTAYTVKVYMASPEIYNKTNEHLNNIAELFGGWEAFLTGNGQGNTADMINAQTNAYRAQLEADPNSVKNQIEIKKLELQERELNQKLNNGVGLVNGNDAYSKQFQTSMDVFNKYAAGIMEKNSGWKIGDVLKNDSVARSYLTQAAVYAYALRPENKGKPYSQMLQEIDKVLVSIPTDKNWDEYAIMTLPELAPFIGKPGATSSSGGQPQGPTPQAKKYSEAQLNYWRGEKAAGRYYPQDTGI